MRFWDASAVVPLFVVEASSRKLNALWDEDRMVIVWWGSYLECRSTYQRRIREGRADSQDARAALIGLASEWTEIEPTTALRTIADRLLSVHPLRAADALQLAAAVEWSANDPVGRSFVCLDQRLRAAAYLEGFTLLP